MTKLNCDAAFYCSLQELGLSENDIDTIKEYFRECEIIIQNGKEQKWLNNEEYEKYQQIINQKWLNINEIKQLHEFMSNMIVVKARHETIEKKLYCAYVYYSNPVHDILRNISYFQYHWRIHETTQK